MLNAMFSAVTLFYTLCAVLQELGVIQRDYTSEYFNMSGLSFSQIYIGYTMQWRYIQECITLIVCLCSDVRLAASHLPPVQLAVDIIAKLMENLSFRDSVGRSVTDLKQLVQQCLSTRETMALPDLVSGLLLTPGLGRYVTHLVPYCKSLYTSMPDLIP